MNDTELYMELELTDDQFRLLQLASEVTGEKVSEFIIRAAIEEADGVAHMNAEQWDKEEMQESSCK